jgi:hypothetical protein
MKYNITDVLANVGGCAIESQWRLDSSSKVLWKDSKRMKSYAECVCMCVCMYVSVCVYVSVMFVCVCLCVCVNLKYYVT